MISISWRLDLSRFFFLALSSFSFLFFRSTSRTFAIAFSSNLISIGKAHRKKYCDVATFSNFSSPFFFWILFRAFLCCFQQVYTFQQNGRKKIFFFLLDFALECFSSDGFLTTKNLHLLYLEGWRSPKIMLEFKLCSKSKL